MQLTIQYTHSLSELFIQNYRCHLWQKYGEIPTFYKFFSFLKFYLFIFGCDVSSLLHRFSLVAASRGYTSAAVHRLPIAVVSLVAECWLEGRWASAAAAPGLNSCGSQAPEHKPNSCGTGAQLLQGMWDLPGSEIELLSLALAGGFFTSEPPGKPSFSFFF